MMNTRAIATEYRLAHWAGIVKDRSESGLSVKAYCENLGVQETSYYYWLKRIREAACAGLCIGEGKANSLKPPVFAEVKLPERPALPARSSEGLSPSRICVEAGGVRITTDGEYPAEKLTELLRTVMRSC